MYFYYDEPELGWLALCAVIGYFAAFSLGVGPVPWILASELFPPPGEPTLAGLSVSNVADRWRFTAFGPGLTVDRMLLRVGVRCAVRGTANSIATVTMMVGAMVTTKLLPNMKDW